MFSEVQNSKDGYSSEPIRDHSDLKKIRLLLRNRPRDLLLFDLATQTGVPMQNLLLLRVEAFTGIEIGSKLPLNQTGTNLMEPLVMTKALYRTFQQYITEANPKPGEYIFKSRKGVKPLTLSSVSRMVTSWYKATGLDYLCGVTSLRKTKNKLFPAKPAQGMDKQRTNPLQRPILKQVKVSTKKELVYKSLQRAIQKGSIPPGGNINVTEVTHLMGVSRIVAREALAKLENLGFVTKVEMKGYRATELSHKDMLEIIKLRVILETTAAEEAIRLHSKETIIKLEKALQEMEQRSGSDEFIDANKVFHRAIHDGADMPFLKDIINQLLNKVTPYSYLFYNDLDDAMKDFYLTIHRKILDAFVRQDLQTISNLLHQDISYMIGVDKI